MANKLNSQITRHAGGHAPVLQPPVGRDAPAPPWARELVRRWTTATAEAEGLEDAPASHPNETA